MSDKEPPFKRAWRLAVERRGRCLCASCVAARPERGPMRDQLKTDLQNAVREITWERTNHKPTP